MRSLYSFILLLSLLITCSLEAQKLKPGFSKSEYFEMIAISARHFDSSYYNKLPAPQHFKPVYRSAVMGLDNRWDLWTGSDSLAVICIRGTTANPVGWLANFYAAMVPAEGELILSDSFTFQYKLASNPLAAVHVGWLVSTAYLSKDILPRLDSCYRNGIKDFFITGHSQGGAISYLVTAYLYNLQKSGRIPADVNFKTYCSAGPKPGNLYFAYDYEAMTQYGKAYNVVNSADWVPETPVSIQTVDDFNKTNPFKDAKSMIRKQKFPVNIAMKHAYRELSKPTYKARRNYQKYLGKMVSGMVRKNMPDYKAPEYYNSNHYVRTGNMIILQATPDYYEKFPDNPKTIFIHHFFEPYLYLADKLPD